jgi:hypothetical protein
MADCRYGVVLSVPLLSIFCKLEEERGRGEREVKEENGCKVCN